MMYFKMFETFIPKEIENRNDRKKEIEKIKGVANLSILEIAVEMEDEVLQKKKLDKFKPYDWIQMDVKFAKKFGKKIKEICSKLNVVSYNIYDSDGEDFDYTKVILSGKPEDIYELKDLLSNEESGVTIEESL